MIRIGYHQANILFSNICLPLEGYEQRFTCNGLPTGIHDPLYVKVLSLCDAQDEQLVISVDLCILSTEYVSILKKAILEAYDIKDSHICICVSHTHSGPITVNAWEDISGDEHLSVYKKYENTLDQYLSTLKQTILDTIGCARANRRLAKLSYTTAKAKLGFNRRGTRKDGSLVNCFSLWERSDAVLDGVVEERIPTLLFEMLEDENYDEYLCPQDPKRIVLFSVGLHPVVMGKHSTQISADYPGVACKTIEQTLGPGTKAMFMLGACGDTEPYLATQQNWQAIDIIGNAVAYSVIAALADRKPVLTDNLWGVSKTLEPTHSDDQPVAVGVLGIGKAVIASVGAECFTQASFDVLDQADVPFCLLATNANGWAGYLPTEEAYRMGGYEVSEGKMDVDRRRLSLVTETLLEMMHTGD